MWCKTCRQDVPAIASFDEGVFGCARCGGPLGRRPSEACHAASIADCGIDLATETSTETFVPDEEFWFDQQLLEAERKLRETVRFAARPAEPPQLGSIQSPHFALPPEPQFTTPPAARTRPARIARGSFWVGLLLTVGLLTFAGGAAIVGWHFITGEGDLWTLGLPITLAGQCMLLLGLNVQVERACKTGDHLSDQLCQLDRQLTRVDPGAALPGFDLRASARWPHRVA